MQKFKVNGQSVPKTEWKQMDREMDGRECFTSHDNAVGDNNTVNRKKRSSTSVIITLAEHAQFL